VWRLSPSDQMRQLPTAARKNGHVEIVPVDSVDATAPAGGINANVTDLAKWMIVQLDSGRMGNRRLWSAERTANVVGTDDPADRAPSRRTRRADAQLCHVRLGWDLRDYRGHKTVSHSGGLAGMSRIPSWCRAKN